MPDPQFDAIMEKAGFTKPADSNGAAPAATNGATSNGAQQQQSAAPAASNTQSSQAATQSSAATPAPNTGGETGQAAQQQTNGAAAKEGSNATPETQGGAASTQFDESKYLSTTFGEGYTSPAELKKIIAEYKPLSEKAKKLEADLATRPTFANEYLKGLNEAVLKGISVEDFQMAQTIGDVTKISDQEALVLQHQTLYKLTKEKATLLVNRKYQFGESYDESSEEVQVARTQAEIDAQGARKSLSELQVKLQTPPQQVKSQEAVTAWKEPITTIAEKTKELSVDIYDDDGKTVIDSVKYPVSSEMSQGALEYVTEMIKEAGMPVNEENLEAMSIEYQKEVLWQNYSKIVQKAYKNAAAAKEEYWIKKTSNSSTTKQETVGGDGSEDPGLKLVKEMYRQQGRQYVPSHERAPSQV